MKETYKYQIGERVVLTEDNPDASSTLHIGHTGIIRECEMGCYAVEYDVWGDELHDCGGYCKIHHGWWTQEDCLGPEVGSAVIPDEPAFDEMSLMAFLGIR